MPWGERKLRWEDFRGTPPKRSSDDEVALTASVIMLKSLGNSQGKIEIEIVAAFDPAISWVRHGHRTPEVLNHEQRHFDLAEYNARRLRSEIKSIQGYQELFDRITREGDALQDQYDRETDHGTDLEAQARWNRRIDDLLHSLAGFSNTLILLNE
jgi:hypothetical protein